MPDTLPPPATASPDAIPHDWPSRVAVAPYDAHNARLVAHVAPRDWVNPTPAARYHLVVIGGGTAGLVSAAVAAGLGARVALVERHLMGGDCLNFGCVPSKVLLHGAKEALVARAYADPAADVGATVFRAAMERLRQVRADLSAVDGAERFRSLGVDVYLGEARFSDPSTVTVGDATLRFRRAIVATGARAAVPPIPGLAGTPFHTNETIFRLTERPASLLVIGGGPIGAELAQAFARFGTRVTLLNADTRVLPRDDAEAGHLVGQCLEADGVTVRNGVTIAAIAHDGSRFRATLDGEPSPITADHLLVAAGRAPNVDGLGLEQAGIAFDRRGIPVDDRMRTSNRRVFAIGDVSSALQFTHVADAQARLAVANALFFGLGGGKRSSLVVPRATYTSPQVAHVGRTPDEAKAAGLPVTTVRIDLEHVDRAVLDDETHGFLKVYLRDGTDEIVGATLVAEHAGDLIGEIGVAITNGVGLAGIGKTIHAYPTQSEVFRKAADQWRRGKLTPFARRVFATFFRVFT